MATGLSQEQLLQFDKDGFLVIPDFFTAADAGELRLAATQLLDSLDMSSHPKTKFTTGENSSAAHVSDDYFLTSGDKVRFFFEEDAFDAAGALTTEKAKAINKIGHALHELNPTFKAFSSRAGVKHIMRSLDYKDPRILQSMVIFKQPKIGGRVPPHQDSTFLYTKPFSAIGFWFALEDCTLDNGCMWFVPGSHKKVPVSKRFVRRADGNGTEFITIDTVTEDPPESDYVCAPVSVGSLVLIHGAVLHKSDHNSSDKSRWIYTFHCIEGEDSGYEYPKDNW
ncbi:hypothetical protein BSLG_007182 [Batrachochytrium salamandrivorans]|nr:hypothetical protein BSLG_007182 [Batrachochytrium salamandrivorans]